MVADLVLWLDSPAADAVVLGLMLLYGAAGFVLGRLAR